MSSIDLAKIQFHSQELSQLFSFLNKTVKTVAPIHISGPVGSGKTTWSQWLISQWPSMRLLQFEGRQFDVVEFKESTNEFISGLICIENVDRISLAMQSDLFSFLDQRNQSNQIKIITTSTKKLRDLVSDELFRLDLFCKLTVLQIDLPPLKNIKDEVLSTAEFYLRVFEILYKKNNLKFSEAAVAKLATYSWPGNFSELENVIERSVILSQDQSVSPEHIIFQFENRSALEQDSLAGVSLSEMERRLILQTLTLTDQNRTKAAQILGISIRTLRNKLHEYKEAGLL